LQPRPSFGQPQPDGFQNAIDILKHLAIGELQNIVAGRPQCGLAHSIVRDFCFRRLRCAVISVTRRASRHAKSTMKALMMT
jgi:hypothetical protein